MANPLKTNGDLDHIYSDVNLFKARAVEELKRARRYATFVSLISIDLSHIDTISEVEKYTNFDDFMSSMRKFVKKSIRETDLIGCAPHRCLWILLVETPGEGAEAVSRRLKKTIRYFLCDNIKSPLNWRVPIKEFSFPPKPEDNGGILTALNALEAK